jgi:hypothetical protein
MPAEASVPGRAAIARAEISVKVQNLFLRIENLLITDVSLTAADENAPHGRKCEPLGLQRIMPEAWRLACGLVKRKNRQALNRNRIEIELK